MTAPNVGAFPKPNDTVAHLLGEIVFLCAQSPAHRSLTFGDIEWLLIPPMVLEQYRIYRDGDKPQGVVLWAKVSDEVERKLTGPDPRLDPEEWNSGDRIWIVEVITPHAGKGDGIVDAMLTELTQTVLQGMTIRFMKVDPQTGNKEIMSVTPEMIEEQLKMAALQK